MLYDMLNINSLSVRFFACNLVLMSVVNADAQTAATDVYTDFDGFWTSSSTSLNATPSSALVVKTSRPAAMLD